MIPQTTSAKDNKLPQIIVDSCILQAAGDKKKEKSEAVLNCLTGLRKEGYKLIMSDFIGYERMYGLKNKDFFTVVKALDSYESKAVTRPLLMVASLLASVYGEKSVNNMDDGDRII